MKTLKPFDFTNPKPFEFTKPLSLMTCVVIADNSHFYRYLSDVSLTDITRRFKRLPFSDYQRLDLFLVHDTIIAHDTSLEEYSDSRLHFICARTKKE